MELAVGFLEIYVILIPSYSVYPPLSLTPLWVSDFRPVILLNSIFPLLLHCKICLLLLIAPYVYFHVLFIQIIHMYTLN